MKNIYRLLPAFLLSCLMGVMLFLSACGGSTPVAHSFIHSDPLNLSFLSWTANGKELNGQYIWDGHAQPLTGYQDTQISLQIGQSQFAATEEENTLQTLGPDGSQVWYAGSVQQYNQLYTAQKMYLRLTQDKQNIVYFQQLPQLPNDSNPSYFHHALLGAQQRVKAEQDGLQDILTARNACIEVSDFRLSFPDASQDAALELPFSQQSQQQAFSTTEQTVSYVVSHSGIDQMVTQEQNDWNKAKSLPFPRIAGLPTTWVTAPGSELTWGKSQVQALQAEVQTDAPQFSAAQNQAAEIQQQVNGIAQNAHC